ncbi:unnamed protein product [Larinioides sclopetarius]
MLAHVENGDNSSSIIIDASKFYSDSLIQQSASIKAEGNNTTASLSTESISDNCQTNAPCHTLTGNCITCQFNDSCVYGEDTNITCEAKNARCTGNRTFIKTYNCRYCYQTPSHEHTCQRNTSCHVVSAPRQRYVTKCTVKPHVLCIALCLVVLELIVSIWECGRRELESCSVLVVLEFGLLLMLY